jgi:hypothetical protein
VKTHPITFAVLPVFLLTWAAAPQSSDFSTKFFDDLRLLFGRLQQSELDQAFRQAKPIRCSDLVGQTGDWKEVAFLNDDRSLGDWYHSSIEEVKRELAKYVFSGLCRGEQGPLKVATSYPVDESSKSPPLQIRDNDPVSVIFDSRSETYTFELPYLYFTGTQPSGAFLYSLFPPFRTSRPRKDVAEEFRCKALSGAELAYRFLLCRTRVVETDRRVRPVSTIKPLGNAAYEILSDGREANSTVKLTFLQEQTSVKLTVGSGVEVKSETIESTPTSATAPTHRLLDPEAATWQSPSGRTSLVAIQASEFRLHFDSPSWEDRIGKTQLITRQKLSDSSSNVLADRSLDYCVWRPGVLSDARTLLTPAEKELILYSVAFTQVQGAVSAIFEVDGVAGNHYGTLQCYFPTSQTPKDINVDRLLSITGKAINVEVK